MPRAGDSIINCLIRHKGEIDPGCQSCPWVVVCEQMMQLIKERKNED